VSGKAIAGVPKGEKETFPIGDRDDGLLVDLIRTGGRLRDDGLHIGLRKTGHRVNTSERSARAKRGNEKGKAADVVLHGGGATLNAPEAATQKKKNFPKCFLPLLRELRFL
jgi:hypothetical protein